MSNPPATPPPPPIPPQYAPYTYGAPVRRTNTLAIVSLVASCAGVLVPLAYIAGIITGHLALSQLKRTGEAGHGMALAGVIVGYALLGISILVVILYVLFVVVIIGIASEANNFKVGAVG